MELTMCLLPKSLHDALFGCNCAESLIYEVNMDSDIRDHVHAEHLSVTFGNLHWSDISKDCVVSPHKLRRSGISVESMLSPHKLRRSDISVELCCSHTSSVGAAYW
jgi:hypothetical protein